MSETLKQITTNYLFDKGYDGLFQDHNHEKCSCLVTNLMTCDYPERDCQPGYKTGTETDWEIKPKPDNKKMIEKIIKNIINREGGFVDHPDDKGGATKYGITAVSLTQHIGREVSTNDIKNVSRDDAYEIYYQQYYKRPNIHQLPQQLQEIVLDMAVNHGAKRAVKILQQMIILNGVRIVDDGAIGPNTLGAIDALIHTKGLTPVINFLIDMRVQFYERIVKSDETQRVFLAGWINRAESFREATA